jgi:hypothetical protein
VPVRARELGVIWGAPTSIKSIQWPSHRMLAELRYARTH